MTATPPPSKDTHETPSSQPESSTSASQASIDPPTAITEDLIDRGAPWSPRTSWPIVLTNGIVVAIVGLLFIFQPLGGSSTTLQLVGLILLGGSLITSFQLWRHQLRPDLEQLAAFRAGSGVTVGLVVIVATFFTDVTDAVTASLAVVVGIGFVVFGLIGITSSLIRRQMDAPLPLASLIANAVLALAGMVLVFAGAAGADTVDGIFNLLGVLLVAAGLALAGYSYLLRQQDAGA